MPLISVVTPWQILPSALPSARRVNSEWLWVSINPGAMIKPSASMTCAAAELTVANKDDPVAPYTDIRLMEGESPCRLRQHPL
ncbi:MAG: hypothetical protein MZU95_05085 [Desulfomicrobium escambiense]|nr:hypothetical protein [Desulfomicrobium escambiense]